MNEFLEYLTLFRVCAIMGRLGSGKTGLAVLLARWLIEQGYADGAITNFPTILPATLKDVDDLTLMDRVIVFDEGWQELDARSWSSNDTDSYGGFARKFNCYWLFPTVYPVDKRLRAITVRPHHENLITKRKVWTYTIDTGEPKPTGGQFSVRPRDFYGLFSTAYVPPRGKAGDCGIKERYKNTHRLFRAGEEYEEIDTTVRSLIPELS